MANISGIVKSARNIMRQDTGTGSDELRILQLGWMLFLKIFSDKDKELELMDDNYTSPIPPELHWDEWAGDDEGMTGDELLQFVDRKLFPTLSEIDLSTAKRRAVLVHEVFANNYNYMKSGIHLRQVINKLNEIDFNNSKDLHLFGQIYETFLSELQSAGTLGEFYTPRAITDLMTQMVNPVLGETVLDPACGTGGFLTAVIEHLKASASTVAEREAIAQNVQGWEYKPLPYMRSPIPTSSCTTSSRPISALVILWSAHSPNTLAKTESMSFWLIHPSVAWCPTIMKTIFLRPTAPKSLPIYF